MSKETIEKYTCDICGREATKGNTIAYKGSRYFPPGNRILLCEYKHEGKVTLDLCPCCEKQLSDLFKNLKKVVD